MIFSVAAIIGLVKGTVSIPKWVHILKYIAACCLTLTFIVVVCVLAPEEGLQGYQMMMLQNSMLYHHFLCPVVVVISFLFFEQEPELEKKCVIYALIPTVIYAATAVILNTVKVIEGPYPFLRVYDQPIYMSIIWCIIILGGDYLFAYLLWKLNRKKTH